MDRRLFMEIAGAGIAASMADSAWALPAQSGAAPVVRVKADPARPVISFLSWDTEGGPRADSNLLRDDAPVSLEIRTDGAWHPAGQLPVRRASGPGTGYAIQVRPGLKLVWRVAQTSGGLSFDFSSSGSGLYAITGIRLRFPFNPRLTPTTFLSGQWWGDGSFSLPGILSAPDFGQMLVSASDGAEVKGHLEGDRKQGTMDLVLRLPIPLEATPYRLTFQPVRLDPPAGLEGSPLWPLARRAWFNAWQPTAEWGDQSTPASSPAGVLGNNVISDPASMSLVFYSDMAFWFPKVAGISIASLVRQTAEWWMNDRTSPEGVVAGYWDWRIFLDANTGPLIAAWDYVESTNDLGWILHRISQLEFIAEYYVRRDVDQDGLVEAVQSGDAGTLRGHERGCCWWDALNCGGKDGYSNALIYRAWLCLADLESKLSRHKQQARYLELARKLKAAYVKTLYNPKTGWLGWWRSSDGELHDYATPVVNGMAIEYGLVEPALGRKILDRLWRKIADAGFTRFELGFPCTLAPVRRADYLTPNAIGCPTRPDGSDTFQQYMNGGITAGQILHFLAAHYVVGEPSRADRALRAMLARALGGGFQDGVTNKAGKGIDWTTWAGKPCGYEGYLADVYFFLQAVLLREPSFRRRYYRPTQSV